MNHPFILAMYRIKNAERWIEKSLHETSKICDEIFILDDDSTDNTVQICKNSKNVVNIHRQKNLPFDETRDKNTMLKMALKRNPEFILTLDGDEILQPNAKNMLFDELDTLYPETPMYEFQLLNIFDTPTQYRSDGVYGMQWIKKLIRISKQKSDLHFDGTTNPGNAHCPSVPQNSIGHQNSVRSNVKILHYGYYDKTLRQEKYQFMNKLDPNNVEFDGYKHILGKGEQAGQFGIELKSLPKELIPNYTL
jgi:glycosyltransferase involved in cell wall biosynthesis